MTSDADDHSTDRKGNLDTEDPEANEELQMVNNLDEGISLETEPEDIDRAADGNLDGLSISDEGSIAMENEELHDDVENEDERVESEESRCRRSSRNVKRVNY